jgi:hypothetical protein
MSNEYVKLGGNTPPPFEFATGTVGAVKVTGGMPTDTQRREQALRVALALLPERTVEEILQAAEWIATGDIVFEEGDNDDED